MLTEHPQFFTATIFKWAHLLKEDNYKDISMQSLKYHVDKNRIILYAFVIIIFTSFGKCSKVSNNLMYNGIF